MHDAVFPHDKPDGAVAVRALVLLDEPRLLHLADTDAIAGHHRRVCLSDDGRIARYHAVRVVHRIMLVDDAFMDLRYYHSLCGA